MTKISRIVMKKNSTKTKTNKSSKVTRKKSISVKGKLYIPRYKIVLMCLGIIGICIILLLITSLIDKNKEINNIKNSSINKEINTEIDISDLIEIPSTTNTNENNQKSGTVGKNSENKKNAEFIQEKNQNTIVDKKSENPSSASEKKVIPSPVTDKTEQKKIDNKTSQKVENITPPKTEKNKVTNVSPKSKVDTKVDAKVDSNIDAKDDTKVDTKSSSETNTKTEIQKNDINSTKTNTTEVPKNDVFNFPKAVNNAELVFLFDDGGQNLNHLNKFLDLPFPITIAVLPKLAHSKESAEKIRQSGKELMLHQPMQAINLATNPGPGAILPDMNAAQIVSILRENLNEIGPVAGINNHEGSAITADSEKMETVLKTISQQGIFFLDSRTNKDTKVPYVCRELGYSYYERNGNFLDNTKTRENALSQIRYNIDIANKNGVVIMIGHIWSADYLPQLLKDIYPELIAKGYTITTVSKCKGKK